MSETAQEEFVPTTEDDIVLSPKRSEGNLLEAAGEAFDEITAPPEGQAVPEPSQTPETANARAAAVQAARAAGEPAIAEDEPVEPEAASDLPPPAPEDWLSEETDYEAEARAELALAPDEDPEDFEAEFDDPRLQEERVKRLAAEKRLEHMESLRVKDARKGWVAEALEHAPLAVHEFGEKLDGIDAKSKRDFLKQAAAGHNKVRAIAEAISPTVKQEVDQIRAEAKQQAADAYGQPTSGPGSAPARAGDAAAAIAAARETKGLRGAIRARLDNGLGI